MGPISHGKFPALKTFLVLLPYRNGLGPAICFARVTLIEKEGDIVFEVKGQHVEADEFNTIYEACILTAEKGTILNWEAQA
jgi:hypothetical protein